MTGKRVLLWRRVCMSETPEGVVDAADTGGQEVILVVEDAETIRKLVCAMLSQSGYRCMDACDGEEALRQIESRDAVDLVLTDVMMPKMGGVELARRLSSLRPDLRVVFMSGYSDDPVVRTIERSPSIFLPKPFTTAALMGKVREILDTPWKGIPEVGSGLAKQ
jgi:two-component system cell cycle sensor histidine kinase/response regulator CckA